eukprot:GHVT01077808.1.p1 GENE.GHVT01077808.1~~GHVT01077808.1.p1  ORF type:complete len:521 (-),score=56.29 GHVT01077808.1:2351-3913(-)
MMLLPRLVRRALCMCGGDSGLVVACYICICMLVHASTWRTFPPSSYATDGSLYSLLSFSPLAPFSAASPPVIFAVALRRSVTPLSTSWGTAGQPSANRPIATAFLAPSVGAGRLGSHSHYFPAKIRQMNTAQGSQNTDTQYRQNTRMQMTARKTKDIILSDPCRNSLLAGIDKVASAVRVTLGPRGRNVLLEKEYGPPLIVNDGVTIARNIELADRKENAGAKLVQEVAATSDDRAGDGTTSTSILTAEIARQGVLHVNQGHNPIPLQKGIQKAGRIMMEEIKHLAKPITGHSDLLNIATVATSGNAVMGDVIARAFDKLGGNAATVLEDNPALEDALEFTEGYTFERGWASPYFLVGEDRDMIEWQNPHVLVCDQKIDSAQSLVPILEHFVRTKEPLIVIAEDFGPEAMQTLIINKMRQLLKVVAVKAPSFGERRKDYLRDIAVATGAQLVSKDLGVTMDDIKPDMLGTAQGIVVRKERTSIITRPDHAAVISKRYYFLTAKQSMFSADVSSQFFVSQV